jgi:hypothetical protein
MTSSNPLAEAYELIKEGRKAEARAIIDEVLDRDSDNADAWWLLAATLDEPARQREALRRVLDLRPGDERARRQLERLDADDDDLFSASADGPVKARGSSTPRPVTVQRSSNSGNRTLIIVLAVIGGLIVVTCLGCLAVTTFGTAMFGETIGQFVEEGLDILTIPDNAVDQGTIEYGQTLTDEISSEDEAHAYTFTGSAGDRVRIVSDTSESIAPFVLLYGPDEMLVDGSQSQTDTRTNTVNIALRDDGRHTIVVRPLFGLGVAPYELRLERTN